MYRDLEEYLGELEAVLSRCRVEYYRILRIERDFAGIVEKKIRERCGENAIFQIYGEGLLITRRAAIASLIRLKRAYMRGKMIARKTPIEYLLRTIGTRKISRAIEISKAVSEGEKIMVIAICGDCEIDDLGGLIRKIEPSEEEILRGMRILVSTCLEGDHIEEIESLERIEKILIGCGLRIEFET
jgi:tRNA threonylcarbamoyladenosine modification (KEOPS) complex Cgi121 subunit